MIQMLTDENWNVVRKDSVSTVTLRRESCLQQLHELISSADETS